MISPLDERYFEECKEIGSRFSERALFERRKQVELAYLSLLIREKIAPAVCIPKFEISYSEFKDKEKELGHDVKALEICIREKLIQSGKKELAPYVHLGLTSEDVNSIAYGLMIKDCIDNVLLPSYQMLLEKIIRLSVKEAETLMPARTHGIVAVPTSFGKEMSVFASRLKDRVDILKGLKPVAKVSGAAGTYASFLLLEEKKDWIKLLSEFVSSFGLEFAEYSTQLAPPERLSDILHIVVGINGVMIALARDLWNYDMLEYIEFTKRGKVGSSTMPHKDNPVDVEDAEGQAELSNAILNFMIQKFLTSRLQRDLSDSPVKRNIGVALAHSLIACKRLISAIDQIRVKRERMLRDLEGRDEVYSEALQILMRLEGDEMGYEKVKQMVREGLMKISKNYRKRIGNYAGLSSFLAGSALNMKKGFEV